MQQVQKLKQNMEQRQLANSLFEQLRRQITEAGDENGWSDDKRVWEVMAEHISGIVPPPPTAPRVMTESEAKQFSQSIMAFGKYKDQKVEDVPLDWLDWYSLQKWNELLRAYLRSKHVSKAHP